MNTHTGYSKQTLDNTLVLLAGGGHQKMGNASGDIPLFNGTANTNLNADLLDGEHAYQLRAFPKNNSSVIFSSLPFLENNIQLFSATPVVSMEDAPEGLCFGPISTYKTYTSDFIAVQPGETLYGEIWAYRASNATGTAGALYCGIRRYDRNKKPITSNSGTIYFVANATTVTADGVWHKYSGTHTLPTSHTVYDGSDGKGVYYIKVYVLVNHSTGTIPTYIGRVLLKRLSNSGENGYIATTPVRPTAYVQHITGTGNITSNYTNLYALGSSEIIWANTWSTRFSTAHYEISETPGNTGNRLAFGSTGQGEAKGINLGNLLVSDAWADYANIPTNGIYSKGVIKSGVANGTAPFETDSTTVNTNLNADLLDGLHGNELVPRRYNTRFYPFIKADDSRSIWHKVTLPWAGYTSSSNAWMMTAMELVFGGAHNNYNMGRIYLQYAFTKNSSNVWTASEVKGLAIGFRMSDNGVTIKYDIANPGIFYIKVNSTTYNSFAIENLSANDTAPSFDFRNTTIEAIAESNIPATATNTVPLYYTLTTQNSYWANIAVQTSSSTTTTPQFARIGLGTAKNDSYVINSAGHIHMTGEYSFIGKVPRAKDGGGGWAYGPFIIQNNDNTLLAGIGVNGAGATLSYMYIGANAYNSTANLKIDTSGYTTATGYKKVNSSDSYVLLGGGGHTSLADLSSSHTHPYLPLAGGTMTGTIYRNYTAASDQPMISLASANFDTWLWRIKDYATGASTDTSKVYGYGLKYIGTGEGVNNRLRLIADNQAGTAVTAVSINQAGQIGIGVDSDASYRVYVSGASKFTGQITSSVADGTKPFIITSKTLNDNLNADLLDGLHASELVPRKGYNGTTAQSSFYNYLNSAQVANSSYVYKITLPFSATFPNTGSDLHALTIELELGKASYSSTASYRGYSGKLLIYLFANYSGTTDTPAERWSVTTKAIFWGISTYTDTPNLWIRYNTLNPQVLYVYFGYRFSTLGITNITVQRHNTSASNIDYRTTTLSAVSSTLPELAEGEVYMEVPIARLYTNDGTDLVFNGSNILNSSNYSTLLNGAYVKLDAGAAEQTIKNSISSLANGSIEIWRAVSSGVPMIGFASGTTKTKWGMLGFSAANTPVFRNTSGTSYNLLHTNNTYVSSNKGYINGTEITYVSNAGSAEYLNGYLVTNPNTDARLTSKVKWFQLNSTVSGSAGYAGNNYGFPVSNNANGILFLGTHATGNYGHQLGFSSNGSIYRRYQNNAAFPNTTNGGSWVRILDSGNSSVSKSGNTLTVKINDSSESITVPSVPTSASPNTVFAGPSSGTDAGTPAFRKLVVADLPSIPDQYVTWGNRTTYEMSVLDSLFNNYLRPNRFAGLKAAGITVEYSINSGANWTTYSLTDVQKRNLFTNRATAVMIGGATTASDKSGHQLRITIDTGQAGIYTVLYKLQIYISTNYSSGCKVTIKAAKEATPTNYELTICENFPIQGWSGWNEISIPSGLTTYGNTASTQYGRIQFTFTNTGLSNTSQTTKGLQVFSIFGYGGYGWSTPSTLALSDHIYDVSGDLVATFPNWVYSQKGFYVQNGGYEFASMYVSSNSSLQGETYLNLGNNRASGTTYNARGRIVLYNTNAYASTILSAAGSNQDFWIPGYDGIMYAAHVGGSGAVGGGSSPVYVDANGRIKVCTSTFLTSHQSIVQDSVTGATTNHFATCSTAAGTAAKTATISSGTPTLAAGLRVIVYFSNKNTAANATFNLNSKGAKTIRLNGAALTTATAGILYKCVELICILENDVQYWEIVGPGLATNNEIGLIPKSSANSMLYSDSTGAISWGTPLLFNIELGGNMEDDTSSAVYYRETLGFYFGTNIRGFIDSDGINIYHTELETAVGSIGTSSATSGSSIAIPYFNVDSCGHVTSAGTHTHTVSVSQDHYSSNTTAGTIGTESPTTGLTIDIPYAGVNSHGHITGYGTRTHTVTGVLTSHQSIVQDSVTGATANHYASCTTAAGTAAKTANITSGTPTLATGLRVIVNFANKNTAANATFNLSNKGAKYIFYNGAKLTTQNAGLLYRFVELLYDGTQWQIVGPLSIHAGNISDYDTQYTLECGNSSSTSSGTTSNGNTYIKLIDSTNNIVERAINIYGTGNTTVSSDASGNIIINSTGGSGGSATAYDLTFRNGSTDTVIYSPHSAAKYLQTDNVSLQGAAATVSSSSDTFKISTKVQTASISANNFGNSTTSTALIDNSYGVAHIVGTSSNTYNLPNGDRYTLFSTRSGNYSSQIAMGNFNGTTNWTTNAQQVWYRYRNSSTWSSWQRLLTYGSRMLSGLCDTNELSPITQSIIHTPNFLFGLDGSYVFIQYKQGSGSWTTLSTSGTNNGYTINNAYRKVMLKTKSNTGIRLGNRSYDASNMNMAVGDGIRFIIDAGSIASTISTLYAQISSLFVYFSTQGHTCSVTIKAQTYANYNSSFGGTWTTLVSSASIAGWAGGNMYYFDTIDFGGNPGQTYHYRMLMIEITVTALQSGATKTDPPILFHIAGYGGNSWKLPTDQADHLRQLDGGYWQKPTIPNPTDYYWANVKIKSSSDAYTSPTFSSATVNGLLWAQSLRTGNLNAFCYFGMGLSGYVSGYDYTYQHNVLAHKGVVHHLYFSSNGIHIGIGLGSSGDSSGTIFLFYFSKQHMSGSSSSGYHYWYEPMGVTVTFQETSSTTDTYVPYTAAPEFVPLATDGSQSGDHRVTSITVSNAKVVLVFNAGLGGWIIHKIA